METATESCQHLGCHDCKVSAIMSVNDSRRMDLCGLEPRTAHPDYEAVARPQGLTLRLARTQGDDRRAPYLVSGDRGYGILTH